MPKRTCSIDGCDKPALARGWCSLHWQRWRAHGDPLHERPPGASRRLNARGYVLVREPEHPYAFSNGYVLEHRKVWYDAHGPVAEGAHIHHINGVKCIKCGASDWYYPPSVSNRRCRVCQRRRERARRAAVCSESTP